jgi:thioesterase domain-containing protein
VEFTHPQLNPEHRAKLHAIKDVDHALQQCKVWGLLPTELELTEVRRWTRNYKAIGAMFVNYHPLPMSVPTYLFTAERSVDDPSLGWKSLVGDHIHLDTIGGTHMGIIQEPHVGKLARAMSQALLAIEGCPAHKAEREYVPAN